MRVRCVDDECELRVDHLQEKFALALGEDFESRLVGGLGVELVAFAGDGDDEIRGELVAADVFLEDGGVHLHFLALFRRLEEWEGGIEKMEADVVGAGVSSTCSRGRRRRCGSSARSRSRCGSRRCRRCAR